MNFCLFLHFQNSKLIIISVLIVALSATVIFADDLNNSKIRGRRSFSWLPFFGGGAGEKAADGNEADEAIETGEAEDGTSVVGESFGQEIPSDLIVPQQIQYSGNYPNAIPIETILSKGQVINNNIHYPIWRVHKYNGLHLKPIPISLVHGNGQAAQPVPQGKYPAAQPVQYSPTVGQQQYQQPTQQYPIPGQSSGVSQQQPSRQRVPPELLQLARQFGITDFSKFPSLEEAMGLLGTTTQEETIKTIQELAATEDGRALIRQFIDSDSDSDAEASEPEKQVVDAPTTQYKQHLNAGGLQQFYQIPNLGYRDHDTAATNLIGIRDFDSSLNRANTDLNLVQGFLPNPAPDANIFQRISQWTNFLNPLAGSEEIPLPSNDEEDEAAQETADEEQDDGQTIPVQLPELPSLPSIPGLSDGIAALPPVHIPSHLVTSPHAAFYPVNLAALGKTAGRYVRVNVPTTGFNPAAQYATQHRPHAQPQPQPQPQPPLIRQPQRAQYAVRPQQQQPHASVFKSSPQIAPQQHVQTTHMKPVTQAHTQLQTYELPQKQISTNFISNVQPIGLNIEHKQQLEELKPPSTEYKTIVSHVGQIPLIKDANYEVFKNAPRIVTSYGTPALPYTYSLDGSSNTFMPSFIHQEYELRPAASEKIEHHEEFADVPSNHATEEINHHSEPKSKTSVGVHDELASAHDSASEIVSEEQHSNKATDEFQRRTNLHEDEETVDEHKEISYTGPQRVTSFDTVATGKIHKADKNAINLLPLTMRHVVSN